MTPHRSSHANVFKRRKSTHPVPESPLQLDANNEEGNQREKVAILESLDLWYDLFMATFIRTFLLTGGQLGSPPPMPILRATVLGILSCCLSVGHVGSSTKVPSGETPMNGTC